MKTTARIACTLAAFAFAGSAAFAQGTSTQTTRTADDDRRAAREGEARGRGGEEDPRGPPGYGRPGPKGHRAGAGGRGAGAETGAGEGQQGSDRGSRESRGALKEAQRELELYAKGTAALDTARYEKALEAFAEAAALKGLKDDSALYWKAFSEYKVQAMQAALESLKEMQKSFPDSRWLEQALALELEVKGAMGKPVSPAATPRRGAEAACAQQPAPHGLGAGASGAGEDHRRLSTRRVSRQRALFVVSQSKSPRARRSWRRWRGAPTDPDLQLRRWCTCRCSAAPKRRSSCRMSTARRRTVT